MIAVTEFALALFSASIQKRISTNSSFGFMPIGCTTYTSLLRTVSLIRRNMLPSEKLITSESPSSVPRYLHIFLLNPMPDDPANILMSPSMEFNFLPRSFVFIV